MNWISVKAIQDGIMADSLIPVGQTYLKLVEIIERQRLLKETVTGIKSGYDELDELTLGAQPGDLIILAGRPGQGKSAIMVNLAERSKVPSLIFSLETIDIPMVRRIAAAKLNIKLKDIKRGTISDEMMNKVRDAVTMFQKMPIKIDSKSRKLEAIKKASRKWVKEERKKNPNAKLQIFIDYLQLVNVEGNKGNREQEVSKISRDLKELSNELEVAIFALAQLNRKVEERANKKPTLADLRESGSLEQDATSVWFIWWEETGQVDAVGKPIANSYIIVAKNREGECGIVQLKFDGEVQRWMNLEEDFSVSLPATVMSGFQVRNPSDPQINWNKDY